MEFWVFMALFSGGIALVGVALLWIVNRVKASADAAGVSSARVNATLLLTGPFALLISERWTRRPDAVDDDDDADTREHG